MGMPMVFWLVVLPSAAMMAFLAFLGVMWLKVAKANDDDVVSRLRTSARLTAWALIAYAVINLVSLSYVAFNVGRPISAINQLH